MYNFSRIEKLAKRHQFIKRKGKISAKCFLNLCTFLGEDLCSASLSNLCAKLEANEKVSISPQALSKRFNKETVNFLKKVFHEMMNFQNELYRNIFKDKTTLYEIFHRIFTSIKLYGKKSKKKGKKTTILILEGIKISQVEMEKLLS